MPTFTSAGITNLATLIFCWLCLVSAAKPNEDLQETYQIDIKKNIDKIVVDGLIEEQTWKDAVIASDFWMSFPVDDQKAKLKTEVRLSYDENFFYVSAVCYDPNGIVIQTLKRDVDFWSGDGFAVLLDPINEKTNGFVFGVNAYGVQMEALITGNTGTRGGRSRGMNSQWDNKWYSKAKIHSDKWTIEMAIPFKSLRYDETKTAWGINFLRSEMGDNSYQCWSPVPIQFRAVDLNFTGKLNWDIAPKKTKGNVAIIPYITGGVNQDFEENTGTKGTFNTGVDAKIAVTSALNLDVTVNPDFSQVEVDEQVTNLTRFNIRLPEKRLFFLENNDVFESFGNSSARPFFSRRIGLDDDGNSIPILYGLRLTGNMTKDLRVGLLNMHTRSTDEFLAQNYTALSLHQKVFDRSVIKGFFLNRQAMSESEFLSDDYGRNAGGEFNYFSKNTKWQIWKSYVHSYKPDITDKNFYYRSGVRYRSRNFNGLVNWYEVLDNYYLDMGFLGSVNHYDAVQDTTYRLGFGSFFSDFNFTFYPKKERKFISHGFTLFNWVIVTSTGKELQERTSALSYNINFPGRSRARIRYNNGEVNLLYPFTFTEGTPLPAQRYKTNGIQLEYSSDTRKVLSYELEARYGGFYSGTRLGLDAEFKYRVQPWGNFGLKLTYNDLQFGGDYGERKLFAIIPRIEINFSNNLFWTTFIQYNSQVENFNVNSRLQWRFAPMSDFFLVYTDNYFVESDDFSEQFRIALFAPKNRAFVFKLNYWLSL